MFSAGYGCFCGGLFFSERILYAGAARGEGIGFDFPGQVDCETGVVKLAPNIPGWVNVPIAQMIEDRIPYSQPRIE